MHHSTREMTRPRSLRTKCDLFPLKRVETTSILLSFFFLFSFPLHIDGADYLSAREGRQPELVSRMMVIDAGLVQTDGSIIFI